MLTDAAHRSHSGSGPPIADRCPFHTDGHCRAAFSGLPVEGRRRRTRCTTEDFDRCPLFLASALRASRPKSRLEPWPLHQK